jgi:DNA polymerase-1
MQPNLPGVLEADTVKVMDFIRGLRGRVLPTIVVDTETNGLNPYAPFYHRPFSCSMYDPEREVAIYVEFNSENYPFIKLLLESPKVRKIFFNLKFDFKMLRFAGITMPLLGPNDVLLLHDAMVAYHQLDEYMKPLKMNRVTQKLFGYINPAEAAVKKRCRQLGMSEKKKNIDYSAIERKLMEPYAIQDVILTWKIWNEIHDEVYQYFADNYEVDIKLTRLIVDIEDEGCMIDLTYTAWRYDQLGEFLDGIVSKFKESHDGYDIGSPKQMAQLLYEDLGLPILGRSETTNAPSTGLKLLKKLDHPVVDLILKFRDYRKTRNTYYKSFMEKASAEKWMLTPSAPDPVKVGMIHSSFHVHRTVTGRLSSSDPNLENIPAPERANLEEDPETLTVVNVRRCFLPPPGFELGFWDFSQIEYRIFAMISQDPIMLEAYNSGEDFHAVVGSLIFNKDLKTMDRSSHEYKHMRFIGKHCNFAMLYGMGVPSLAKQLKTSRGEAYSIFQRYHARFPSVKTTATKFRMQIRARGFIEDLFGRRYRVPVIALNKCLNNVVQGTAAGVFKRATINVGNYLAETNSKSRLINLIHDEVVILTAVEEKERLAAEISPIMEYCPEIKGVPIKVGSKWHKKTWCLSTDEDEYLRHLKELERVA